ncbi:hypothetical protein FisN_17Lu319 [Fistulifera solaris]|uniref:Uncharacterized protein n=1 Tax=Fistulifera solaris TaxID=1519565 RepID=A0A1Z5J5V7_FISSO|nr:hypothetical protein FisN_17Lu319 [Fistulifera solaris]|eukprot:GAX09218.1 hypothetical protein FisN_17Lu319 [Fistulifera solaris]
MTEDTVPVRNYREDVAEINDDVAVDENDEEDSVSEASTMSSVTDTSFKHHIKKRLDEDEADTASPPKEIFVSVTQSPDKTEAIRSQIPLPRPASLGTSRLRQLSAPRTLTNKDSQLPLIQETPSIRSFGYSEAGSSIAALQLLGNRPKYTPRQMSHATVLSVGSFVGQSSCYDPSVITAPETTCGSSDLSMRRSLPSLNSGSLADNSLTPTTKHQGRRISSMARKVMQKELKQMINRVATPLRRFAKSEDSTELQRANGFLT